MNDSTPDPEIRTALGELAPPPTHGPGFWDELNTSISVRTGNGNGQTPNRRGRYLAVAAAAAVVLVGGALLPSLRGDRTQGIDVAIDTTTTTPTATSAPSTTLAATTTLAPADGARPSLVGTPIDDSWIVLYSSTIAVGDYVGRAVEDVDCGSNDLAFASDGIITRDYGRRDGSSSFFPGPQGVLAVLTINCGSFEELSVGSELGGPAESLEPLTLSRDPLVVESFAWDLVRKVMVATVVFDTESEVVRINDEGEVTIIDASTNFPERAASELFHYDVGVPDQFSVDYATGRGVSLSVVGENFDAGLQLSNYLPDSPDFGDLTQPYDNEVLESGRTLAVPLYERNGGNVVDRGVTLEVDEVEFSGGFSENRIVRIYAFDDRSVVAELRYRDGVLADDPQDILDDIRMFNAAFEPVVTCSSIDADVPPAPAALNPRQRATFEAITAALADCDWDALDALTPPTFMASFGGGDPIELWRSEEAFDEPILDILLDHLSVTPAVGADGMASWPRASTEFWEDVTDEMKGELIELGYSERDFGFYEEIGYIGYRTGIDADGTWIYFVTGD